MSLDILNSAYAQPLEIVTEQEAVHNRKGVNPDLKCGWHSIKFPLHMFPLHLQQGRKHPERDLILAMFVCFIAGFITISFSLCVYLFYWDEMKSAVGGFDSDPVVWNLLSVTRLLIFGVLPTLGLGFFCVGYFNWKTFRALKLAADARTNPPDCIK